MSSHKGTDGSKRSKKLLDWANMKIGRTWRPAMAQTPSGVLNPWLRINSCYECNNCYHWKCFTILHDFLNISRSSEEWIFPNFLSPSWTMAVVANKCDPLKTGHQDTPLSMKGISNHPTLPIKKINTSKFDQIRVLPTLSTMTSHLRRQTS